MKKYKIHTKPAVIFSVLLAVSLACYAVTVLSAPKQGQESAQVRVTTSFYPVYIAALNVTAGAENITLTNLTDGMTGCPHEYQMTPQNMRQLSNTDILLANGAGMEEFLESSLKNYPHIQTVDLSSGLQMLTCAEHEHEGQYAHEHDHAVNGHVWINPGLYLQQIESMADALARADSANAQLYQKNAGAYQEKIREAVAQYPDMSGKKAIIFHDSLEYLCDYLHIQVEMTVDIDGDVPLSAATVAQAVSAAKEHGVDIIFCEKQYSGSAAESVAREAGIPMVILDSGVTGHYAADAYINLLRNNLAAIKEAV